MNTFLGNRVIQLLLLVVTILPLLTFLLIFLRLTVLGPLAFPMVSLIRVGVPLSLAMLLFYEVLNFRSSESTEMKLAWGVGLLGFFIVVAPFYWYYGLWRGRALSS